MTAYPTNAQEYLDGHSNNGSYFLLFNPTGDRISADANAPIAVNKETIRNDIQAATGIKLPTIDDFRTGPMPTDVTHTSIDWNVMRTAATGLAIWVHRPDLEPSIYLVQNDGFKKVNPNKWNFPSQLVGAHLHEQAFRAANSEMGLLIPTIDGTKLIGLNFDLPDTLPQLDDAFKKAFFMKRTAQEANLRKELTKRFPQFAQTPIEWHTVKTIALPETDNTRPITVSMAGQEFTARAHTFNDSSKTKSFNVHFPVSADLSTLPNAADLDFANAMAIDPEQYGRNHTLHTAASAKALASTTPEPATIPAPTDYFLKLEM